MTATNDDLLTELQKQTALIKDIKKLFKGIYINSEQADNELSKVE